MLVYIAQRPCNAGARMVVDFPHAANGGNAFAMRVRSAFALGNCARARCPAAVFARVLPHPWHPSLYRDWARHRRVNSGVAFAWLPLQP